MEKKKVGIIAGAILVLALVAAIGVVYAAYTQSLYINGSANVKANSWKIKFTNLSSAQLKGEATEVTAPTITNDTKIGDYSVLISKPGDSITYTFDIVNEGTFNATAEESSITGLTPTCTGTGDNATQDAANVCKHLTYSWGIPQNAVQDGTIALNAGNTLTGFSITLSYSADVPVEDLPKNDVAISGLDTSIVFTQAK